MMQKLEQIVLLYNFAFLGRECWQIVGFCWLGDIGGLIERCVFSSCLALGCFTIYELT